jgi:hypothetical protein
MKILGPNETGRGILIEYDAGHVSPEQNKKIISEMRDMDERFFEWCQEYNVGCRSKNTSVFY